MKSIRKFGYSFFLNMITIALGQYQYSIQDGHWSFLFRMNLNMGNTVFFVHLMVGLLMCTGSHAQYTETDDFYRWFDATIGEENSGLYYAEEYVDEYLVINDQHRYFKSPYFEPGTLYYDGRPYFDVMMKYDLYEDFLITRTKNISGLPPLKMQKRKIDSFTVHGQRFINIAKKYKNMVKTNELYAVLYETPYFTLFKKPRKKNIRKLDRRRVYYNFNEDDEYAFIVNGTLVTIRNRKDVKKQFTTLKKTINDHYRIAQFDTDGDQFMLTLFEKIFLNLREKENGR